MNAVKKSNITNKSPALFLRKLLDSVHVERSGAFFMRGEIMESTKTNQNQVDEEKQKTPSVRYKTGETAEQILKKWLLERDIKTKLACVIMEIINNDDHNTGKLWDSIFEQYTTEICQAIDNPPENLEDIDHTMIGVAAELLIWRKNYFR